MIENMPFNADVYSAEPLLPFKRPRIENLWNIKRISCVRTLNITNNNIINANLGNVIKNEP